MCIAVSVSPVVFRRKMVKNDQPRSSGLCCFKYPFDLRDGPEGVQCQEYEAVLKNLPSNERPVINSS